MNQPHSIDKRIVFDHFNGLDTPLQKKQVEEWLLVAGNREQYYEWLDEWERLNPQCRVDASAAFDKLMGRDAGSAVVAPVLPASFPYRRWLVAAAIVLLLAGSFFFRDTIRYKTFHTGYGETSSLTLPDGSLVTLNANSVLRYNRFGFGEGDRQVFLKGEADFSVVHTRNHNKFLVTTGNDLDIVVLGTQFTVYARPTQSKVVLKNGKVEVKAGQGSHRETYTMKPGDLFTRKPDASCSMEHVKHPEAMSAWKTNDHIFDHTSLEEIQLMLRENYNVHLSFPDSSLLHRTISGTLHAGNGEELVDAISALMGVNYKMKADTVYLVP